MEGCHDVMSNDSYKLINILLTVLTVSTVKSMSQGYLSALAAL